MIPRHRIIARIKWDKKKKIKEAPMLLLFTLSFYYQLQLFLTLSFLSLPIHIFS